jgi:diadenosine tetraphosphatase ApaH/serine/threonine PP2A family protein phosphatase
MDVVACVYFNVFYYVVFLIPQVNGWEMHYMEKSFLHQCKERFGVEVGEHVWEECNQAFDRLPLAAVIDHEIFCIHGGFPRPIHVEDGDEGETQLLVSTCSPLAHVRRQPL